MALQIKENLLESARHRTFYLEAGPTDGTPMIFVHGWPELSASWRNQLPVFGGLGFRCIAPDMRGYGRSTVYRRHEDYALSEIVPDMIELLDSLGAEKAIWVGHDWGAPVVWSLAQQYPERCHALANLCVPYQPGGFGAESSIALADRSVYPEDKYPAAQWDYQLYYREAFEDSCRTFEANVPGTVRALFRGGSPKNVGQPAVTAAIRAAGGWFGGAGRAPDLPRDERVLTEDDEKHYVEALTRNGFFGPNAWYLNAQRNFDYAEKAKANWRLKMPVLFLHGAYDFVCATVGTRLADPMRENVDDLTEATVYSGHWMAQEKPADVNAQIAKWLAVRFPQLWLEPR